MNNETLKSCLVQKWRKTEYCKLKGSFPLNPHGRVEIPHSRVPVAEKLIEKTHGRVEIPHGRVEIQISRYTSSFQIYSNWRATRACENSTQPCGCPISCLFKADFRISKIYTLAETVRDSSPTPRGLRLGFRRGFLRLWRIVTTRTKVVVTMSFFYLVNLSMALYSSMRS